MQSNSTGAGRPSGFSGSVPGSLPGLVALCAAGAVVAILMWHMRRPAPAPVDVLVGTDITGSHHPGDRKQDFKVLNAAVERVLPARTSLTVWTYDVNAREVASPQPQDARSLLPLEKDLIFAESNTFGTYPAEALKKMVTAARESGTHNTAVACMLLTDGEDTDEVSTRSEVTQLASLSNVKAVWIIGVAPNGPFRSLIKKDYAELGDRLIVSGRYDSSSGLSRFRERLEGK